MYDELDKIKMEVQYTPERVRGQRLTTKQLRSIIGIWNQHAVAGDAKSCLAKSHVAMLIREIIWSQEEKRGGGE